MYHILVNPKSSCGKGKKVWEQVRGILEERKIEYELHLLKAEGDAERITSRLTSKLTEDVHLLVLGGDGTLSGVLNGIEDFPHTVFSCIRTGSGNDFARNVKLEKDTEKALRHLLDAPVEKLLDYGIVTAKNGEETLQRRFLISCGAGYDADICVEVEKSKLKAILNRFHMGKLVYLMVGLKQIFTRKNCRAKLRLDDGQTIRIRRLFFAVGMQHEYEGGGVPFCPGADAQDGLMDVCLVRDMTKGEILLAVAFLYLKRHFIFRGVTAHRCKKMRLLTEQPQWIHMDGEPVLQARDVTWEVKSGLRLRM